MRPEKPKKVEINPQQQGLSGLGNALAGVNLGPLPAGDSTTKREEPSKPRRMGRVILRRETAHRGGRVVIVVHDFPSHTTQSELESLAKRLRQGIGTGGAVKERTIEIQGEHAGKIRQMLEQQGYQVAGV